MNEIITFYNFFILYTMGIASYCKCSEELDRDVNFNNKDMLKDNICK